jgi:hypothetical protein
METAVKNNPFGKRLKVGQTFLTTTPKLTKHSIYGPKYKRYRDGDKDLFQKGKRKYYCEVICLAETKVGWYITAFDKRGPRYWQFTYLVRILNN